jgi:hypothetical protein
VNEKIYFAKLESRETQMLNTGVEVSVWYAIKSCAGKGLCFASIRELAQRARVTNDSVLRAIKKIETAGLIKNLGKLKAPNAHWATYHLQILPFDSRTKVSDSRTEVFEIGGSSVRFQGIETEKETINKTITLDEKSFKKTKGLGPAAWANLTMNLKKNLILSLM